MCELLEYDNYCVLVLHVCDFKSDTIYFIIITNIYFF